MEKLKIFSVVTDNMLQMLSLNRQEQPQLYYSNAFSHSDSNITIVFQI